MQPSSGAHIGRRSFAGAEVGDYKLERKLGAGPFGEVYLAQHIATGHRAAVKLLYHDPEPLKRRVWEQPGFNRLVQALCAMAHEFIVDIYCFGASEAVCFFAEELLEQRTLRRALQSGERLTVDDVLALAGQILIALDHAHQRDIQHLDLRPENIFLFPERGEIKVTDFSTLRISAAIYPSRYARGYRTPYSAPEVANGTGATVRSDIYSFGALMFELLTGKPLIVKPPSRAISRARFRHLELDDTQAVPVDSEPEDPKARLERVGGIPAYVIDAVLGCLARDPAQRWEHVRALRIALGYIKPRGAARRAPAGLPLAAAPPPRPPQPLHVEEKVGAVAVRCPSCRRLLPPNARACLACGAVAGAGWHSRRAEVLAARPYAERFFLEQGDRLFAEGRFAEAEQAYRNALEASPDDSYAHNCLGDVLCAQKKFREAQRAYERAVELNPKDLDAKHDLARVLLTRHKTKDAARVLEELLAAGPPEALAQSARIHLGAAYAQQGKPQRALALWRVALERDPQNADLCYSVGALYAQCGDYSSAEKYWKQALAIDPNHAPSALALARLRPDSPQRAVRSPLARASPFVGGGLLAGALLGLGSLLSADPDAERWF